MEGRSGIESRSGESCGLVEISGTNEEQKDGSSAVAKVRPTMLMGEEGEEKKLLASWFAMQLHA
jgi:hypothetical protein